MDPAGRPTETPRTVGWPVRSNFLANLRQWWSRAGARVRAVDFGEAFWKGSAIFSLVINLVLVAVVILLALNLFGLKRNVVTPLIGGLHTGFVQMDEAHIRTTVTVTQEVPVTLDLPIEEETVVVLSEPTTVEGANVSIRTGALSIAQAPSTVMLPAGTELPIRLSFKVPVETTIPVEITVPVDIPLAETELHGPFVRLRDLFATYKEAVAELPDCWSMALWGRACE